MSEKKKTGRWERRRRRWIPNEVSPDCRSMVLDTTYDEEKGQPPYPENGRHDSDSAEYPRWPEAE